MRKLSDVLLRSRERCGLCKSMVWRLPAASRRPPTLCARSSPTRPEDLAGERAVRGLGSRCRHEEPADKVAANSGGAWVRRRQRPGR